MRDILIAAHLIAGMTQEEMMHFVHHDPDIFRDVATALLAHPSTSPISHPLFFAGEQRVLSKPVQQGVSTLQQHTDHKDAAEKLADLADKAGLTALASAARLHASHSIAAAQAHATGDVKKKAEATAGLLTSAVNILEQVGTAEQHPEVLAQGHVVMKALGEGIAASV